MITKVITAMPLTHKPAKLYQPNMVENQRASSDIIVSKAKTGMVNPNNTRKIAETVMLFLYNFMPPTSSSWLEYLYNNQPNMLYKPSRPTMRIKKKGIFKKPDLPSITASYMPLSFTCRSCVAQFAYR